MSAVTEHPTLLSGNEALALGAYHAGIEVATGYPGTPSTEVLEYLARITTRGEVNVEWSTNEKVALDVGIGASLAGVRVLVTMKHVGVNVAMDSLMTSAFIGVKGGLVLLSADDPGMHSSQNEQDNRYLGRFAGIPVFEPADSQEVYDFVQAAFEASERWDLPCLLRTTTRTSHARSRVRTGSRTERGIRPSFDRNPSKYVMLPANARRRHLVHLDRLEQMQSWVEDHPLTTEEMRSPSVGVVTAGISYHHVREVLPEASVLKLGIEFPVATERIRQFAAKVSRLFVVEELEPYLEDEIRRLGIAVEGKELFPRAGELSAAVVRKGFIAAGVLAARDAPVERQAIADVGPRPPVLCPGCPHSTPYMALGESDAIVTGDIGCYTLAAGPPITSMDTCLAMGSSIGMATGLAVAGLSTQPIVATIGDSTFLHGGIPALLDAVHRGANITVVILDNGTTAMTGGQPHPGIANDMRGDAAARADIAEICKASGIKSVVTVDPYDVSATRAALRAAISQPGVSVVVTSRACVEAPVKSRGSVYTVISERCDGCQACMRIGCPAIVWELEAGSGVPRVEIDPAVCTGCTICAQLCPSGAIISVREVAISGDALGVTAVPLQAGTWAEVGA
ncbi:MAG: indolepyruvate ferredoxin oxidoreductase subunit alpha [Acidimicrobiales bacterium]